ncbi:MAG: ABC transporter permease [Clostridiales bacterium]|nr:ABC transporter permease [Clostridiales bacterium]
MKTQNNHDLRACGTLVKRNVSMYFKDKGTFFTSLITPIILLVLYATFLYNVYEDTFSAQLPEGLVDDSLIQGLVGGVLLSSLLAVSTVTVPFCANLFMVQDKVTGARGDLSIAPVKPSSLAFGYYIATVINGLIISFVALAMGLVYLSFIGWYLSFTDVLLLISDVVLLVLFGTALSSLICYPLRSQGAMSAVGTIVSSGYGFICGAYMPISSFGKALQNTLIFLPGTHGTSLIRNHALNGVFEEMLAENVPQQAVDGLRAAADCRLSFFGNTVEQWVMYLVLAGSILLMLSAFVIIMVLAERKNRK